MRSVHVLQLFACQLFAVAVAAQTACPPLTGGCSECPLSYDLKGYPEPVLTAAKIGWAGANGAFADYDMLGPYLIPMQLEATNRDTMLIWCSGRCTPHLVPGDIVVNWEIVNPPPPNPDGYAFGSGAFVTKDGQRKHSLSDTQDVLYLPPEDLAVNDFRFGTIRATLQEKCAPPCPIVVEWSVGVLRYAEDHWAIAIQPSSVSSGNCQPPLCISDAEALCELVGPSIQPCDPPVLSGSEVPTQMYLDEVRPFTVHAKDLDGLVSECGIPVWTYPCSTYRRTMFCDYLTYTWWTVPVAGWTGQGSVSQYDATAQTMMFVATAPGKVRVHCQINGGGELLDVDFDVVIVERPIRRVDFDPADQQTIQIDGTSAAGDTYRQRLGGWEFYSQAVGNEPAHNFPMAYRVGKSPKLRTVEFKPGGFDVMPGGHLIAVSYNSAGASLLYQRAAGIISWYDSSTSTFIDATTTYMLPSLVKKDVEAFSWYISAYPQQASTVGLTPSSSSHTFYCTLNDPLPLGAGGQDAVLDNAVYRGWETAYDLSCTLATGAGTALVVEQLLAQGFHSRALTRKVADGYGVHDQKPLKYWDDWNGAHPNISQSAQSMLGNATGIGSCIAWSQLMRLCLGLQGVGGRCVRFYGQVPFREWLGGGVGFSPAAPLIDEFICIKDWVANGGAATAGAVHTFGLNVFWQNLLNLDPSRTAGGVAQQFYLIDRTHVANAPLLPGVNYSEVIGVPGQGPNTNPPPWFNWHVIVRVGTKYYDPSYGEPNGLSVWATADDIANHGVDAVFLPDMVGPIGLDVVMKPYTGPGAPVFQFSEYNY